MKLINFTHLSRMEFHVQSIHVFTSPQDMNNVGRTQHILAYFGADRGSSPSIIYFPKGSEFLAPLSTEKPLPRRKKREKPLVPQGSKDFSVIITFDIFDNTFSEFLIFNSVAELPVTNPEKYRGIFKTVAALYQLENGSKARINTAFSDILINICEEYCSKVRPSYINTSVYPAIQYIDSHPLSEISVPLLAKYCEMSLSGFRAHFKDAVGISPVDYISAKKLEKAKELINEGAMSINAISDALGFANSSYFSRFYRERTGHTPTEDIITKAPKK